MTREDASKVGFGFLTGWLAGRRSRRRGGTAGLLLFLGVFGLIGACMTVLVGVPLGVREAFAVRGLPVITAVDLDSMTPGERALFIVQLPEDAETDALGLVASQVEARPSTREDGTPATESDWAVVENGLQQVSVVVVGNDGAGVTAVVQLAPDTGRRSAQTLESQQGEEERRHSGYLPGQTVTIDGTWIGDGQITAGTISADAPDAYVQQVTTTPATMLLCGLLCGAIALLMLGLGVVMRFVA